MENEKLLIDAKPLMQSGWHLVRTGESNEFLGSMSLADVPTVEAYTEEQLVHILNSLDKVEAENKELRKENVWLKSCLNCKIRKECPRHCGKVVHNCDHWEYGDNAVEVVHGRWLYDSGSGKYFCSACDEYALSFKKDTLYGGDLYEVCLTDYCPNCGAKMDGERKDAECSM